MKEKALESAKKIAAPSGSSLKEFSEKWEKMAAEGTRLLSNRADYEKLIGQGNQQMAKDNNRNFPRFMESLFSDYIPEVFLETVLWVFRAYRSHGFQTTYWPANLNLWVDLLKKELSPKAFEEIEPFYNWIIVNIPVFVKLTDKELTE
nr:hypothetical protein [uncultured Desulfobacter sp.]